MGAKAVSIWVFPKIWFMGFRVHVSQEVLHVVARKLGEFHRDRPGDTFRGWLRRITNNKVNDHYRKQNKTADKASGGVNQIEFLAAPHESPGTWNTSLLASDVSIVSSFKNQRIQTVIKNVRANISQRDWKLFWRIAVCSATTICSL